MKWLAGLFKHLGERLERGPCDNTMLLTTGFLQGSGEGMRERPLPAVAGVYRKSSGSYTYAVLPGWSVHEGGRICDEQGREPEIYETPTGFLHARLPMTRSDYPAGARVTCSVPIAWAVCTAFHGEKEGSAPFGGPPKWVPRHRNGDLSDNRAENLCWERASDTG